MLCESTLLDFPARWPAGETPRRGVREGRSRDLRAYGKRFMLRLDAPRRRLGLAGTGEAPRREQPAGGPEPADHSGPALARDTPRTGRRMHSIVSPMSAGGYGANGGSIDEREMRTIRDLHDRRTVDRFLQVSMLERDVSDRTGEPQRLEGYQWVVCPLIC